MALRRQSFLWAPQLVRPVLLLLLSSIDVYIYDVFTSQMNVVGVDVLTGCD